MWPPTAPPPCPLGGEADLPPVSNASHFTKHIHRHVPLQSRSSGAGRTVVTDISQGPKDGKWLLGGSGEARVGASPPASQAHSALPKLRPGTNGSVLGFTCHVGVILFSSVGAMWGFGMTRT